MTSAAGSARKGEPLAVGTYVEPVERSAVCDLCGRPFTQFKLSDAAMAMGHGALARAIPDGHVPIFCPPCERRQLTSTAPGIPRVLPRTAFGEPIHDRAESDGRYEREEREAMADA